MKPSDPKTLRCAIYTRVSTEHGLEQDFNSLHAQREAAQAFIKSQAHEGWRLVKDRFDDPGYSGGSMERPALKALLAAIDQRTIDIVVVYKVDRLTRSLTDFAKLVEAFDARGVSFVSVTQAFNTTTSMGRLTLNVLLSFAQFEREVTGERIRDKIAASKSKGMWMGGVVPLGYRVERRSLQVVAEHAALVRSLFTRYLVQGSVVRLHKAMLEDGTRSPERVDGTGRGTGGGVFSRGHLYKILSNPLYVGRMVHKGRVHQGQHAAIIAPELWDAVQARLAEQTRSSATRRENSEALLLGKRRDERGNLFTPTYTVKNGRRYRYYVSRALMRGRPDEAGPVTRVPAIEIEAVVTEAVARRMAKPAGHQGTTADTDSAHELLGPAGIDPSMIRNAIDSVTIGAGTLDIAFTQDGTEGEPPMRIAWTPPSPIRRREIVLPDGDAVRPIRAEARDRLLSSIARARTWLGDLTSGRMADTDAIARREGKSERSVRMLLPLAFVAPDIVAAAIQGNLPRGFGLSRLTDLPVDWAAQRRHLGLPPHPPSASP